MLERYARLDPKDLLTRDEVLATSENALAWELVDVPEWRSATGASKVIVQELSADERDLYEMKIIVRDPDTGKRTGTLQEQIRATIVQLAVKDPKDGLCLFSPDDVEQLGKLSGAAMQRVFSSAMKLSKLTEQDIEELAENLEKARGGSSSSTSPSPSVFVPDESSGPASPPPSSPSGTPTLSSGDLSEASEPTGTPV